MNPLQRLLRISRRHWAERNHYVTMGDWLMSIYNRTLIHAPYLHLPGRGRIRAVHLSTHPDPLLVRLATSDWYAMEEVFIYGEYAPMLKHLRQAETILDLGANVGMSVRLWQAQYPGARIVAVEPDAGNLQMLRRNAGQHGNAAFIQACVAGRPRMVALDRSRGEYAFRMQEEDGREMTDSIPALTVPQILEQAGVTGDVDLLKCDIEGTEAELFAECRGWIDRIKNMVVEVHDPYTSDRLQQDLQRSGAAMRVFDRHSKGGFEVVFLTREGSNTHGSHD